MRHAVCHRQLSFFSTENVIFLGNGAKQAMFAMEREHKVMRCQSIHVGSNDLE